MKLTYSNKDLKKHEKGNVISSVILVLIATLGVYFNSTVTIWAVGAFYVLTIMIVVLGYFLLDIDNIKDIIKSDEKTAKSAVNVMYSNNLYKFVLTAFEMVVFALLNLPVFVLLTWAGLGVSLMYKHKLQKHFEIKDVKPTKFKDRDEFNKKMKKKDKKD